MDTASGVALDLDNPRPGDIRLGDIAAVLSKVCRFAAKARGTHGIAAVLPPPLSGPSPVPWCV
jgi:hypothetical protein